MGRNPYKNYLIIAVLMAFCSGSLWASERIVADKAISAGFPNGNSNKINLSENGANNPINSLFIVQELSVLKPTISDVFIGGRQDTIKWSSNSSNSINLYYTTDNGVHIIGIGIVPDWPKQFLWNAPLIISDSVQIIAVDHDSTSVISISNRFSLIAGQLNLTKPLALSEYKTGDEIKIVWTSNYDSNFGIFYSIDDGDSWNAIDTVTNADSPYTWIAPNIKSDHCLLSIRDLSGPSIADTSGLFLVSNATISLLSPNGGEKWNGGTAKTIKWESANIDSLKIEYSIDSGRTWKIIRNSIPASLGEFSWNVPVDPSSKCFIRLTDILYGATSDLSDGTFEINGLVLTSLNLGEKLLVGSSSDITWVSNGINNLAIQYSSDNGDSWTSSESAYSAVSGRYSWDVPMVPSDRYLVKIYDPSGTIFRDESDMNFTVSGILVEYPKGGEVLYAGNTETIKWQSANISKVKIEYTPNNGADWVTIISNENASAGEYNWQVPKNMGNRCKIRISSVEAPSISDISKNFFALDGTGIIVKSPNGDEIETVGEDMTISWVQENISKVNILLSTNYGKTWNTIRTNVSADAESLIWTIPSTITASTECLVKIEDADNSATFDISDDDFHIQSIYYNTPVSWEFADKTGANSVVIVPTTAKMNFVPADGDAIGVFYTRNGTYYCAGYSIWNGSNLSITVWGDNPRTEIKDGLANNDKYVYRYWDATNGEEYSLTAQYDSGNAFYTEDGISVANILTIHNNLTIHLPANKWTLISSNLYPNNSNIEFMLESIVDKMEYVKDDSGAVYYPAEKINTIKNWGITRGYQIYMKEDADLLISGAPVNPRTYPRFLYPNKWYITAYLPQDSSALASKLWSLTRTLLMVKNSAGDVYFPSYGIDNIHYLKPGEGYKMCVTGLDTLVYDADSTGISKSADFPGVISSGNTKPVNTPKIPSQSKHYIVGNSRTGNSANIVVQSNEIKEGDEVAVVSASGKVYGEARYENGRAVITIWGDNTSTKTTTEGALESEDLGLRYYSTGEAKEFELKPFEVKNLVTNSQAGIKLKYSQDAVLLANVSKGNALEVKEISQPSMAVEPNPASDYINLSGLEAQTTSKYSVIDAQGNIVMSGMISSGNLRISTEGFASGAYNFVIYSGTSVKSIGFVVVK